MSLFETAESGRKVDKATYEKRVQKLRADLLDAQYDLKDLGSFPVIVLINGLDGAGKGEVLNLLNEWMDPRHIETRAFGEASEEEKQRPRMWRYWRALPPKGKIGILFGNWYADLITRRAAGKMRKRELGERIADIQRFERLLADDNALLLKYWFHLTEKDQHKRLEKLAADPATAWRVTTHDWQLHERYQPLVDAAEHVLNETDSAHAHWVVIDGSDDRQRALAVGEHLFAAVRARIARQRALRKRQQTARSARRSVSHAPNVLAALNMSQRLGDKKYERELGYWQGQLNLLSRHPKFRKRSAVLVFEGMDAAGKGGAIRRITAALDARHYQTIPVAAPSEEEKAHPYLWRFWRHIPGLGQFAIFDRSWYGRVLVERVEGLCSEAEWKRAYDEINDFERQLIFGGAIVSKFWLSVSPQEQLRRFKAREETRFKRFKITPEDWRNRDKWPLYEVAVNEMVARTSTDIAPWHLIAGDDKKHARIEILRLLCERLEAAL